MTITAIKPVEIPTWATTGGTRLTPTVGQQASGWLNTQIPPHNIMNWLQGLAYDWQQYLEDATDQLESSKLNLSGGTMTGAILASVNGLALGAAVGNKFDVFARRVDVRGDVIGGDTNVTCFSASGGGADFTQMTWDEPALQSKIRSTRAIVLESNSFDVYSVFGDGVGNVSSFNGNVVPSTSLTRSLGLTSARWSRVNAGVYDASDAFEGVNYLQLTANPLSNTPQINRLCSTSMPKAWGVINITAGVMTLVAGFNVAGVVTTGGVAEARVTMASGMLDANYAVLVTPEFTTVVAGWIPGVVSIGGVKTAIAFDILINLDTGAQVDLDAGGINMRIHFVVFGRQ